MLSKSAGNLLSRREVSLGALAAGVALWTGAASAAPLTLRGEVVYRERMALPRGARVEVQLVDMSLADAPARVLATAQVGKFTGSPIPFTLRIDSRKLRRGRRYALQARISDNRGKLMFINDTVHAWKSGDAGPFTIQVVRAGGTGKPGTGKPRAPAEPWGRWVAEDILGGGVAERVQSVLDIRPDGHVSGHGGCNGMSGAVRVKGKRIVFGRMASTMMACPSPQMNQERRFHEALRLVRGFRVEEEPRKLLLLDGSNRVVMRLAAG